MAEYRRSFQQPDPTGPDRWSMQGGDYYWYLPDRLTGRALRLSQESRARLDVVTEQLDALGERFRERPLPALYATLLRSESIASSRIEGVREDPSAVLLAAVADTPPPGHSAAQLITRNIDTVRQAVESLATRRRWTSSDIDALHHTLLPDHPVGFRDRMVWISGSTPVRAKYVAPHPDHVPALVDDLVTYLETTDDPPLVRAALSHAQLETIHPWSDGNGRTGRALIQAVLARSGTVSGGVLPVSVVLGHRDSGYVSALSAFRYDPRRGETADEAREAFVSFFLQATSDAVVVASDLLEEVQRVGSSWARRTTGVRAHSAQHQLLALLADRPVLTIPYALDHTRYRDSQGNARQYSRAAIGKAFTELEAKGIVDRMPTRDGRLLVYRAREILDLLVLNERRLGSIELDTVFAPLSKHSRQRAPGLPGHDQAWRRDRVGSALRGDNPTVLRRLRAGFAVIGDAQHFPGYCVLISDDPTASSLTDLPRERQELFLADAALLARAVERVARRRDPSYRGINLEVQGNTDAFLHAHVTPRHDWEPEPHVRWPAALTWRDGLPDPVASALGPQHDELRAELTAALDDELRALDEEV